MNNLTLDRADVCGIVEAMAQYLEKDVKDICPEQLEDEPPFCGRVMDTRESPDDFKSASKEWTARKVKVRDVELLHGERWLGGRWPRLEFLMATTADGWTLDLVVRAFDRVEISREGTTMASAIGGDRHAEIRAWMKSKGLSDSSFAATVPAPITTARKWIYEGSAPRAAYRTLLERSFPDCPALRWK